MKTGLRRGVSRHRSLSASAQALWRRLPLAVRDSIPACVVARLLVVSGLVVAHIASRNLTPLARPFPLGDRFLAWDAAWYRGIADVGYDGLPAEAIRFFPLYPLLGRVVAVPLLGNVSLALVLVANVLGVGASVLGHRLVERETGDQQAARRAAWFMALFPSAFVLMWGYAESLLLVASLATFFALRSKRWVWAAVFGAAAGLSRPIGLLLVLPALVEVARGLRTERPPVSELARRALAVLGPAAGTASFLVWSEVATGDWWAPIDAQEGLRGDARDPVTRLFEGVADFFGGEALGDALHVPFAVGLLVLLIACARRLPASYTVFSAAVLVIALGAENLNSLERYGLNAFPLVLVLGITLRHADLERLALVACAGGMVAFTTLAWLGLFVP